MENRRERGNMQQREVHFEVRGVHQFIAKSNCFSEAYFIIFNSKAIQILIICQVICSSLAVGLDFQVPTEHTWSIGLWA